MAATPRSAPKGASGKTGWKAARRHHVVLPSGFEIEIEVPNLSMLVKTGYLPNDLVAQALQTMAAEKLTAQTIAEQADFYAKLVTITVKDPELSEEDVLGDDPIPFEDIELIVELATRQRDVDAVGNHLGGLHKSKVWQNFRGLSHVYSDVESP